MSRRRSPTNEFNEAVQAAVSKFTDVLEAQGNAWRFSELSDDKLKEIRNLSKIDERKVSRDWNIYKHKTPLENFPRITNGFGGYIKYIWIELKENKDGKYEPDPSTLFYATWNGHNFYEKDIHKKYEVYEPVYLNTDPSQLHLLDKRKVQENMQTLKTDLKNRLEYIDTIYKEFQKVLKQEYEYQKKFAKESLPLANDLRHLATAKIRRTLKKKIEPIENRLSSVSMPSQSFDTGKRKTLINWPGGTEYRAAAERFGPNNHGGGR